MFGMTKCNIKTQKIPWYLIQVATSDMSSRSFVRESLCAQSNEDAQSHVKITNISNGSNIERYNQTLLTKVDAPCRPYNLSKPDLQFWGSWGKNHLAPAS